MQSQYGIIETKWGYPEAYAGTNLGMSELVSAEGGLVYQGSSNSARYGFDIDNDGDIFDDQCYVRYREVSASGGSWGEQPSYAIYTSGC